MGHYFLYILCVQEVVTQFLLISYYIKWVTSSWTQSRGPGIDALNER